MKDVTIYTTSKCNIRCKHCGVGLDQDHPRQELSTQELKKVIKELAHGGAKTITILGGEATIYRRDLGELLDFAFDNHVKVIINTNLISYASVVNLLDKPALQTIVVSLDGATSDTHDNMRGKGTFQKTVQNIRKITKHKRYETGDLLLQIAFVMTGINYHETSKMLFLATELSVRQLNIKNVRITGRASLFNELLGLSREKLLDVYSSLITNWMLTECKIELEILIPPAFAEFLNKTLGLCLPTNYYPACGGTNVFSYVDLLGNHLPCPAMSYEEKPSNGMAGKHPKLNLLENSIDETLGTDVFNEFELKRANRGYKNQLFPCKHCKYNTQCQQCVAQIVSGESNEEEIEICSAVYHHGSNYVEGIREEIWNQ